VSPRLHIVRADADKHHAPAPGWHLPQDWIVIESAESNQLRLLSNQTQTFEAGFEIINYQQLYQLITEVDDVICW
jgi:hypothetical protein